MKVLVDTNVVVSAILKGRKPAGIIQFIAEHPDMEWIVSPEILDEYISVIRRPKFHLSEELVQLWCGIIKDMTTVVVASTLVDFPRDQKDAKFLACAISGNVDIFVTGDHDFEEAKRMGNLRILSVSQFQSLIIETEDA